MRSREEVIKAVKNPGSFIVNDLYMVGLVELYPFVPVDCIPEAHRKMMDQKVLAEWNPDEEYEGFSFNEVFMDEYSYLLKLVDNDELNAAIFRCPRLLAISWLNGNDITKYDKMLGKIIDGKYSVKVATRRIKDLLFKLKKEVID